MTGLTAFTVLVALVGPRAPRRASRLEAQRRVELRARRRGERPRPLPGDGGAAHRACSWRCSSRHGCAARRCRPRSRWSMLALVLASQALRWWCIATLGRRWNTRVIVVPGLPPVDRRALPAGARTPTTSRSSSRASRCRWCTPPGSPPLASRCSTRALLAVRIRVEDAALRHAARASTAGA